MAVKPILRMGDPRLRQVAAPVDVFDTRELHALVADMFDTMRAAEGAGLAAPQIGVSLRVMVFGVEHNPRYPNVEAVPTTVLINPSYEVLSPDMIGDWEGCLSVPGMRGYVARPSRIRYSGVDQYGKPIGRYAEGFHATVFQHENDHLDGVLYPDRIVEPELFGFIEELSDAGAFGDSALPSEA